MIYDLGSLRVQTVGDEFFVAPSAAVIGRVHLGRDASVWFGAVLRGDSNEIRIGDRSNVQDNAVIHIDSDAPTNVGHDVTIGHSAVVHGCTVGDFTLIGIGATILSHAKIGNYCLVGAGALITERKEFPDGSLIIGAPARRHRALTDEERRMLEESAAHYVAQGQRYRRELAASATAALTHTYNHEQRPRRPARETRGRGSPRRHPWDLHLRRRAGAEGLCAQQDVLLVQRAPRTARRSSPTKTPIARTSVSTTSSATRSAGATCSQLIEAGGNVYYLAKFAGIFGLDVQDIGAQQTGMSVDEFKAKLESRGELSHGTDRRRHLHLARARRSATPSRDGLQDDPYWKPFFARLSATRATGSPRSSPTSPWWSTTTTA